jgi:hypothetical protein
MAQLSEGEIAAARLQDLLSPGDDGAMPVASATALRDFIALCVLELGLEVTPAMQPVMKDFLAELGLPPNASGAEYAAAATAYFAAHPIDGGLIRSIGALGRDVIQGRSEGFRSTQGEVQAMLSIGVQPSARAPADERSAPRRKPRKGLR